MQKADDDKNIPTLEELMTDVVREDYERIRKERQRMICHRSASGIVAALYLVIILFSDDPRVVVKLAMILILPLAAIWFSDDLGSLTGVTFGRFSGPVVTTASPGVIVRIGGWILLLSPVIADLLRRFFL